MLQLTVLTVLAMLRLALYAKYENFACSRTHSEMDELNRWKQFADKNLIILA